SRNKASFIAAVIFFNIKNPSKSAVL
ncbi:hypothetical protein PENNAL_c0756G02386, partial [Penicillium nalgiovense]